MCMRKSRDKTSTCDTSSAFATDLSLRVLLTQVLFLQIVFGGGGTGHWGLSLLEGYICSRSDWGRARSQSRSSVLQSVP